jgi:uncharacterized cysteine cluster protein YcgN (CxxCxxCC family)
MPKKKKLKNMTEEDWEKWGDALGKRIEKKFENFGKNVEKKTSKGCCKWDEKLGGPNQSSWRNPPP